MFAWIVGCFQAKLYFAESFLTTLQKASAALVIRARDPNRQMLICPKPSIQRAPGSPVRWLRLSEQRFRVDKWSFRQS
jgi:hypothetical protein